MRLVSFVCAVVAVTVLPAAAQDPVKVAPNVYHVIAENERVRVLHVAIGAGVKTPMHEHPANVIVPLTPSSVKFTTPDGKSADVSMKAEEVVVQPAEKHAGVNTGAAGEVIVIELKGPAGTATLPPARPGMKSTTLAEDARVRVVRASIEPSFTEAAGTTHDYDQVVVMLGPGDVALTMEGKTTSSWKRGDVRLIGKGVAHETKGGKQAGEIILVTIK